MTTGTLPQRNVSPWADLSTMRAGQLVQLHVRAGLELDLANFAWCDDDDGCPEGFTWWLLVRSATEATHHDRWCFIE